MEDNILDKPFYYSPHRVFFLEWAYAIFCILLLLLFLYWFFTSEENTFFYLIGNILALLLIWGSINQWNYSIYSNRIEFYYLLIPHKIIASINFKDIHSIHYYETLSNQINEKEQTRIELNFEENYTLKKELTQNKNQIHLPIFLKKENPKKIEELIEVLQENHPNFKKVKKD